MNVSGSKPEQDVAVQRAVEIAVRLTLVGALLLWCFRIFQPFLIPVLWGMIIAVALFPLFGKMVAGMGGRKKLAAGVFTVVALAILIVPTFLIAESLIESARSLSQKIEQETLELPPPPAKVKDWPVIGESVYTNWALASENLQAALVKFTPMLKHLGGRLVGALQGAGGAVFHSLFAILVAGIFLATAESCSRAARNLGRRMGGDIGVKLINDSVATIRSVAQGVLGVALVQSVLAGLGLFLMQVPAAGLWTVLVMIVAIIQLPPILILGPVAFFVFAHSENTVAATIFLVWCIIVSGSDAFLKPMFLGRGVDIPMPVILIGALGGMVLHGFIGLFVGAVVLAIGYSLVKAWIAQTPGASGDYPIPVRKDPKD